MPLCQLHHGLTIPPTYRFYSMSAHRKEASEVDAKRVQKGSPKHAAQSATGYSPALPLPTAEAAAAALLAALEAAVPAEVAPAAVAAAAACNRRALHLRPLADDCWSYMIHHVMQMRIVTTGFPTG